MKSLGFITLLIGSYFKRLDEDGLRFSLNNNTSSGTLAYLTLRLATKKSVYPLKLYKEGFPYKDLFFKYLKPWE